VDDNNQNRTNPFGAYRYGDDGPNRPRDISSDLWTPISTGVPAQETRKLQDQNETPPAPQTAKKPKKPSPAKGRSRNGKPQGKPKTPSAGKPAQRRQAPQNLNDRPVIQQRPQQPRQPARRPEQQQQRQPDRSRARQQQQRERMRRNDERKFEKNRERYENERTAGRSSDDIRRDKARRKRRNKKMTAVITVAVVMLLAGIVALVYCYAYGAPISKITVSGKTDYTNEEIIAACGVDIGDNMLRVRSRDVNKSLTGMLPYIQSAKVEYKLPDTLVLKVTQTKEKYLIVGKGSYLCLSEEGKVLSLKKKKVKDGQFRLEGFDWQEAVEGTTYQPEGDNVFRFETAKTLVKLLEQNELTGANTLKLDTTYPAVIQYEGRINIYLNINDSTPEEELNEKLSLAAGILKNEVPPAGTGYIDARFEGRAFYNTGSMTIDG